MKAVGLVFFALLAIETSGAIGQAACPDYVACMNSCATLKWGEERCMQRCQKSNNQCFAVHAEKPESPPPVSTRVDVIPKETVQPR
jgi:hypothetical protein